MEPTKKRALGMGLEQLFNNESVDISRIEKKIYESANAEEIIELPLEELRPNPYQPRKIFHEEALRDLADSISEHGVFQPIIVKKSIKGYEIIAGERRYRASKLAGKETIPAIVRQFTDAAMMEIALLENLQRENLSAIEEAEAYRSMITKLSLTQEELSKKVGKSRSHITNILGLLRLPKEVQELVISNEISMGHARTLSKLESDDKIVEMAKKIVENKMPVRDLEKMTDAEEFEKKIKIARKEKEYSTDFKHVENMLREKLDAKVKINDKKIEIHFNNVSDLNRILEIIEIKE